MIHLRKEMLSSKTINITINRGLCESIVYNPKAILNSLVFFCDAICLFDKAPDYLEKLFQRIIDSLTLSFKDSFSSLFETFPPQLKSKMTSRFSLLL